jgi:hypothetical protein
MLTWAWRVDGELITEGGVGCGNTLFLGELEKKSSDQMVIDSASMQPLYARPSRKLAVFLGKNATLAARKV